MKKSEIVVGKTYGRIRPKTGEGVRTVVRGGAAMNDLAVRRYGPAYGGGDYVGYRVPGHQFLFICERKSMATWAQYEITKMVTAK